MQGNAAETWLGQSQIIDSTDMSATGCFGTCDVNVEGIISDAATEDQIRRLGEAATDYRSAHEGDDIDMSLSYGKVSFQIGETQDETASLVGLALTAFNDERVTGASAYQAFIQLSGAKADVSTLFDDYAGNDVPELSVRSDDEDDASLFMIREGTDPCEPADSLVAEFDQLLGDPSVTTLILVPCATFTVEVAEESARDAMIAQIQPFASDPAHAAVEFSIESDEGLPYAVTADTPQLDPLFALIDATPGVSGRVMTGNVISVGVSDPAQFRQAVSTIDAAPRPAFVEEIRVGHALASVYLNGDGTLDAQVTTAESMFASNATRAADDLISFTPQTDGTLEFGPVSYDEDAGVQIVDAVVAGGLWQTSSTVIEVFDQPIVFTVTAAPGAHTFEGTRTNETPETTRVITELNTYWAARTKTG
ncbi:hypothetical protein [Cryobacterium arcticum]|uniref:Uncharacterized protein n=1 Tax=Cryobacterium arcticum TaxID=670052 RepID=A0A317ZUH8_9MICO|nr:hypothetical protein [Cryobacterium arcticum]PXA68415.1 hypothetical protein CTB96_17590 [Cryobacterium arcticum]